MATYDAGVHVEAFEHMEQGKKTVYVLPATPEYSMICSGDRVEFGSLGSITAGAVRKYTSLEDLCAVESWHNLVPEALSQEEAISAIRGIVEWDPKVELEAGVVAVRVRETRRKI